MDFQKKLEKKCDENGCFLRNWWELSKKYEFVVKKRPLKYFSKNVAMNLARMRPENINLNFIYVYIFFSFTIDTVYENSPVPT